MRSLGWIGAVALIGCGGDKNVQGGGTVPSHATVVHGATSTSGVRAIGPANAADGMWSLTPNKAQLTFTDLTFTGLDGQPMLVTFTDCKPTYQSNQAPLSQLVDCAFDAPFGTYGEITLSVSTTYQVTIDDATNGFFSDPTASTKMSPTAPSGGAQMVSFTAQGPGGTGDSLQFETYLTQPLVVDADHPVDLHVVVDMIHMFGVQVAGGTLMPVTNVSSVPAMLVATAGTGKEEFYSAQSTAENLMTGPPGSTGLWGGVRIFYATETQPSSIFYPVPGPSEADAADPANVPPNGTNTKAGGYLGIDSTNTLCWAMPTDGSWMTYTQVCRLPLVASGGSTLSCQHMATAPHPTSGDTYASGCPTITADVTVPVTLIAK